jgi:hypothetical protein
MDPQPNNNFNDIEWLNKFGKMLGYFLKLAQIMLNL